MESRLKQLRRLRHAALGEGVTLLVLLGIAVPLKYMAGQALLVKVMGPLHGVAFLYYLSTISDTVIGEDDWTRAELWKLLVCAMLPFGAWYSLGLIRRKAAAVAAPVE